MMMKLPDISRLSTNECHALIQQLRRRIEGMRSAQISEKLITLFREALLPAESSYVPPHYTARPQLQDMLPLVRKYGFVVLSGRECGDDADHICELTGGLIQYTEVRVSILLESSGDIDDPEACSDDTEFHSYVRVPAFMHDESGGLLPGTKDFVSLDYDCDDDWYLRPGHPRPTSYGKTYLCVFYPAHGKALERKGVLSYHKVDETGKYLDERCDEPPRERKRALRSDGSGYPKKIHHIPSFVV